MNKEKKFNPLVSIVIPVYNGSNYLKEAIDSALSQTYENIEILVINDGSNDNGETEKIAKSYGDKVKYFSKKNGGVSSALNLGIKNMQGEYFSWLSHDDYYYSNKISYQINFLKKYKNKKNIILYSNFDSFYEEKKLLKKYKSYRLDNKYFNQLDEKFFYFYLIGMVSVHGCTLLIPKKCFDENGIFDENLKTTQDYDLWFKFSRFYKFIKCKESLICSRLHKKQGTRLMTGLCSSEGKQLYLRVINNMPLDLLKNVNFLKLFEVYLIAVLGLYLKGYKAFILKFTSIFWFNPSRVKTSNVRF